MNSIKKALLFSFLIWLIAFGSAFLIFPIHQTNRVFFESIMPVILSILTSFFTFKYFQCVTGGFINEGLLLGIIIILVNWLIDAGLMLTPSPMQMTLSEYFQDIGFTYFMILPITMGYGFVASHFSTGKS